MRCRYSVWLPSDNFRTTNVRRFRCVFPARAFHCQKCFFLPWPHQSQSLSSSVIILGASPFIVPLIRAAKKRGFRTLVCSNLPDDPGLREADEPHLVSILDEEAILQIARNNRPDAVLSAASDLGIYAASVLNKSLNLQGVRPEQVEAVSDKGLFHRLQQGLGLPAPACVEVESESLPSASFFESVGYPAIVKPFFASGSRGVARVNHYQDLEAMHAETYQQSSGRKGYVFQQFLEGYEEVGCEAMIINGKVEFLESTHKFTNEHHAPIGHCVPGPLNKKQIQNVSSQINAIAEYLGVEQSPVNLDIMLKAGEAPVIIDMGFRLGGNLLPLVMGVAFGWDPYDWAVRMVTERIIAPPEYSDCNGEVGSLIFGSMHEQIFTPELKSALTELVKPHALECVFDYEPGAQLPVFTQGSRRFGHALVRTSSLADYVHLLKGVEDIITHGGNPI